MLGDAPGWFLRLLLAAYMIATAMFRRFLVLPLVHMCSDAASELAFALRVLLENKRTTRT
jgi:hypothetical protein